MKLLRLADQYLADHPETLLQHVADIERIEAQFGCELEISLSVIKDFPQDGQETLGWFVEPENMGVVCVYPTFNWGPGAGPRVTLKECLDSLKLALDQCIRVGIGKPGLTGAAV